jgi:hypothetical protein
MDKLQIKKMFKTSKRQESSLYSSYEERSEGEISPSPSPKKKAEPAPEVPYPTSIAVTDMTSKS